MAYRRRRSYSRSSSRKRVLEVARLHGTASLNEANNMRTVDLLGTAVEAEYLKDLTPSTVVGVQGYYTWWTPATTTAQQMFLGVGLLNDSRRQVSALAGAGEEVEAQMSPLDEQGRYQRWHFRKVSCAITQAGSGYEASQQAADNKTGIRVKSNRKLHTVDDTYYLVVDTQGGSGQTVNFFWELTVFLKRP